jgi:hypothetical protein
MLLRDYVQGGFGPQTLSKRMLAHAKLHLITIQNSGHKLSSCISFQFVSGGGLQRVCVPAN